MLVKATAAQTSLWEYSRQTEINGDRMLQLLQRVITFEKKLSCSYDQLAKKCLSISLLYCSYLLDVAKDIVLAKKILNDLAFNEEFEVNLDVTNKLFLRLDLTSQPLLRVAQVGCNVTNLLGFSRK